MPLAALAGMPASCTGTSALVWGAQPAIRAAGAGADLELLQGEAAAHALLHVVLDRLAVDDRPQQAGSWPGEGLGSLVAAGCRCVGLLERVLSWCRTHS